MNFDLRETVVQSLTNNLSLKAIVDDRYFQSSSMAVEGDRPFVVVKLGLRSDRNWRQGPTDQLVDLWIHDDPGDYHNIDVIADLATQVYEALKNTKEFLEARFVSISSDLEDPDLGTIFKVARYQWTTSI
jgi:hypothetical protein